MTWYLHITYSIIYTYSCTGWPTYSRYWRVWWPRHLNVARYILFSLYWIRIKAGFNSSHMVTQIWVNFFSNDGLLPDGTRPLPKPILTHHLWGPLRVTWGQFHKKILSHQSLKSSNRKCQDYVYIKWNHLLKFVPMSWRHLEITLFPLQCVMLVIGWVPTVTVKLHLIQAHIAA